MGDLPNCPLCGGYMRWIFPERPIWIECASGSCIMPSVLIDQLRALAALRKPMTVPEAWVFLNATYAAHPDGHAADDLIVAELTRGSHGH